MPIQQVQLGRQHLLFITHQQTGEPKIKFLRSKDTLREILSAKPAEIIIHGAVYHVTSHVVLRVFPYFADDDGIPLFLLHSLPESQDWTVMPACKRQY